jgi:uncharacterized membrane protein YfcA
VTWPTYAWLAGLGFGTGAYGTLIGAGGGFVLMPLLLLLYPGDSPHTLTSISLAVVFFNAASGAEAYAMMKRIDYRAGLLFAVTTVPGAVVGALTTSFVPRRAFDLAFGALMVAVAAALVLRPRPRTPRSRRSTVTGIRRVLTDAGGETFDYTFDPWLGMVLSLGVGYLSSLLGIGGGIIHVPILTYLLGFPVHVATATSHFLLAIMAFAGSAVHVVNGAFGRGVHRTVPLAIGALVGAQIGARLSSRVRGAWIIRSLALALGALGVRVLTMAFGAR